MTHLPVVHRSTLASSPEWLTRQRTLLGAFLSGRSPQTLRAYERYLQSFRTWLRSPSLEDTAQRLIQGEPGEANAVVLAYRSHLVERGLAPATINRRLAALRSVVDLARTLGMASHSLEVASVRAERYRDTRGPGSAGVRLMLAHLNGKLGAIELRNRAILRLLFDLGLRRTEVVSLDLEHVDLAAGALQVLGKGRAQRESLTIPRPTQDALRDWITVRGTLPGPFFINFDRARKGKRLTGTSVYRLVREIGRQVGLKVRPHGLRHAAITAALDLTAGDVRAVQRFSRHRDIKVLTVYDDCRRDLGGEVARRVAEEI
jgi:integrase/recombinase XerC